MPQTPDPWDRIGGLGRPGGGHDFGQLAFGFPHVEEALEQVLAEGGRTLGEVVSVRVPGRGRLTFVYACDPEGRTGLRPAALAKDTIPPRRSCPWRGNVIELQSRSD